MDEMNYAPDSGLGLLFSIRRGQLLIYHAAIMALRSPEYVRFLYNDGKRRFAVQCCEKIDRDGVHVPPEIPGSYYQCEINCRSLLEVLYKKCEWDHETVYRLSGVLIQEYQLIEFYLDEAEPAEGNLFIDPENREAAGIESL